MVTKLSLEAVGVYGLRHYRSKVKQGYGIISYFFRENGMKNRKNSKNCKILQKNACKKRKKRLS